jgi:hypothetical protein
MIGFAVSENGPDSEICQLDREIRKWFNFTEGDPMKIQFHFVLVCFSLIFTSCGYLNRAKETEVRTSAAAMVSAQSAYFAQNKKFAGSLKDMGFRPEGGVEVEIMESGAEKFTATIRSQRSPAVFKIDMTPNVQDASAIKKIN